MSSAAKPELLTAAGSIEQAERYIRAGADAVLIGEPRFGMRQPGTIPASQLAEAVSRLHALGAKAYINMNKLFRNDELPELPDYLKAVAAARADAVTFGDPAVLLNVREHAPGLPLHWNAEMTGTNSAAADYWGRRGAVRAVLARELNEEEIASFKRGTALDIQVQVHGMTNIYHSHRNLLQSYMEHLGREASLVRRGPDRSLYLVETERPGERFPVYEDETGTHVMSPDDICLIEALPELVAAGVDSMYVEPLLKSDAYNETVLRSYRAALDRMAADPAAYAMDPAWLEDIRLLQDPERELGFGFLYKEQVY
ncbi:U32 family peptidase [Cohnella sp. CFH 77786]|uniref:peptidase U32 family protein n=1 Tax=Cohnella sp. CFH 77786 TaxID=2662265 RepID=UPI001C60A825|nr:peptidase U32 family protein [Cohnella sp. CFH 77786]MBW5444987.1 U32 family peptidase [Cohnella sp. CFH 77786]